jgi:hypothetical protein
MEELIPEENNKHDVEGDSKVEHIVPFREQLRKALSSK